MQAIELLYIGDFEELADVGERMQQECEPDIPYARDKLIKQMFDLVNDMERNDFNCWIVKHKDRIVGFAIAQCFAHLFTYDRFATLSHIYVLPTYRGSRVAFELLNVFEQWAKGIGARRLDVGAWKAMGDTTAINRMYAKRGYKPYGELFYKDI